jgi:hypothetical protein
MQRPTTKRLVSGLAAVLAAALVATPVAQARLAVHTSQGAPLKPAQIHVDARHAALLNRHPEAALDKTWVTPVQTDSKIVQMHRHLSGLELPGAQPNAAVESGSRFDWTDAGIGAAAGLGLVLLAGAGVLVTRRKLVSV